MLPASTPPTASSGMPGGKIVPMARMPFRPRRSAGKNLSASAPAAIAAWASVAVNTPG
jgi:hypothetical protein